MLPPILQRLRSLGYATFVKGPWNLNIVAIRNTNKKAGRFDDLLTCTYKTSDGEWRSHYWEATTDPGIPWLISPMNPKGTAILVPDQYRASFSIGLHRGRYTALVQSKPVKVYRDNNRNEILDWTGAEDLGMHAIQIHAKDTDPFDNFDRGTTDSPVGKASAGCIVVAESPYYRSFIGLVQKSSTIYGNDFTVTLVTSDQIGL